MFLEPLASLKMAKLTVPLLRPPTVQIQTKAMCLWNVNDELLTAKDSEQILMKGESEKM